MHSDWRCPFVAAAYLPLVTVYPSCLFLFHLLGHPCCPYHFPRDSLNRPTPGQGLYVGQLPPSGRGIFQSPLRSLCRVEIPTCWEYVDPFQL